MELHIIVLAAGKGTRMLSGLPKVVHTIADKPMLAHLLATAQQLQPLAKHIIVGYQAEQVQQAIKDDTINWVTQTQQLGTAHAVRQVLPSLPKTGVSLILYGDVPLISRQTLQLLLSQLEDNTLGLITQHLDKPTGYGRVIRDTNDKVCAIVEQKDASIEQLLVHEVNTGMMAVNNQHLHQLLPNIGNDNAQAEYYLTDLIALAVENDIVIKTVQAQYDYEVQGVNDKVQLAALENIYQRAQAEELLKQGVHIVDPNRVDIRGEVGFGEDCRVDINCIFEGQVSLGKQVSVGANCILKNAQIGDYVIIKPNSLIEDSIIESYCEVGPFARVRPDTHLQQHAKIGNFVETKKSTIGVGSKINHLSYIGDAQIGDDSNIGAGTITCNYDGVNKHRTKIGNGVRIGSNTSLIAPVEVGDKATTGAGVAIRKNVEKNQLAVSNVKQKNIDNWQRPEKIN